MNLEMIWTPDCQGKWDYGEEQGAFAGLVSIGARMWPPSYDPQSRWTATCSIELGGDSADDDATYAEHTIHATTEQECRRQVEEWCARAQQYILAHMKKLPPLPDYS